MADVATSLLDFILDLLRDPRAAASFEADPTGALASAGLSGVSASDVHAVLPVVLDYAPVCQSSSFDRTDVLGARDAAPVTSPLAAPSTVPPTQVLGEHFAAPTPSSPSGSPTDPATSGAVAQLHSIINNYTYEDERSTVIDHSVNQDVFALGDVNQTFVDHSATATGDGAVAGDPTAPVTTGDGDVVGAGNSVGDTTSTDSHATTTTLDALDSFNDSSDHSTATTTSTATTSTTSTAVTGSLNGSGDTDDHSTNLDHSFDPNDSFDDLSSHPTTTTTTTAVDSGNDSHAGQVVVDHSGNGSGNGSGDETTTTTSDSHAQTTDVNAAFNDSHDDSSTNLYDDNSTHSTDVADHDSSVGDHLHL